MRAKAAERRAAHQAENERLLRDKRQRAPETLAEIERKLGCSNVNNNNSNDSRTRHYSEHSNSNEQSLRFGSSNVVNDTQSQQPIQQFKLMQRPKSIDSNDDTTNNDTSLNTQSNKQSSSDVLLKKQKPIQLVTKLQHDNEVEQSPIKIVPQIQSVSEPSKPAWKPLPQVQPLYTYDAHADDEDEHNNNNQSSSQQTYGEHDRFINARTSDELIAAAAETFTANEFDRGTQQSKQRNNSNQNPNNYISTQRNVSNNNKTDNNNNDTNNNTAQQRRMPVQPRKWASDIENELKPSTTSSLNTAASIKPLNTVRSIPNTASIATDNNKVLNIMDLPLTAAGLPILPGLSTSTQSIDRNKQSRNTNNNNYSSSSNRKDTVKQVTDITAAVPADKPRRERKNKSIQNDDNNKQINDKTNNKNKSSRNNKKEYTAKSNNNNDKSNDDITAATNQLLNDLQYASDIDDGTDSGFERVLSKKEREELAKKRREQENAILNEKQKLARQDEYKQKVEREKNDSQRSHSNTPTIEPNAVNNNTSKSNININTKTQSTSSSTNNDLLMNQLQAVYPSVPATQLEQYITSQKTQQSPPPTEQSNFMSMFRQSPVPSLSPVASYADSPAHTSIHPILSPSITTLSGDEYLVHQNTASQRDHAIRTLIAQQQAQQLQSNTHSFSTNNPAFTSKQPASSNNNEFTPLTNQLFNSWNEQTNKSGTTNNINTTSSNQQSITSPFSSANGLGLTFGGLSSVNLSHIHVLAQHFGMAASNVAKFTPQQLAALTATYQQQTNQANTAGGNNNTNSSAGTSSALQQLRSNAVQTGVLSATSSAFISFSTGSNKDNNNNSPNTYTSTFTNNNQPYNTTSINTSSYNTQPSRLPLTTPSNTVTTDTTSNKSSGMIKAPLPHRSKVANNNSIQSSFHDIDTHSNTSSNVSTIQSSAPPASSRLHGWIPKSAINDEQNNSSSNIISTLPVSTINDSAATSKETIVPANNNSKPRKSNNNRNNKQKKDKSDSMNIIESPSTAQLTDENTQVTDDKCVRAPMTATRGRGAYKQSRSQSARIQPIDSAVATTNDSKLDDNNTIPSTGTGAGSKRNNRRGGRPGGQQQPRDDTNTTNDSKSTTSTYVNKPQYKPKTKSDNNNMPITTTPQPSATTA